MFSTIFMITFLIMGAHSVPIQNDNSTGLVAITRQNCQFDEDCGHGECKEITNREFPNGTMVCECDKNYLSIGGNVCNYDQIPKINAFLASFLGGYLGADRFYMARGSHLYNGLGFLKLITVGGVGIWWLVDWILILTDQMNDGNGYPIGDW